MDLHELVHSSTPLTRLGNRLNELKGREGDVATPLVVKWVRRVLLWLLEGRDTTGLHSLVTP
jgi:hypothetical protein